LLDDDRTISGAPCPGETRAKHPTIMRMPSADPVTKQSESSLPVGLTFTGEDQEAPPSRLVDE
jgi:hypothetical protein